MNSSVLDWLLEPVDPGVRYLALRDLCEDVSAGDLSTARKAAHQFGPISQILAEMLPQGTWVRDGQGYLPKYFSLVWSLITLAQLGGNVNEDERIARACEYLFKKNLKLGNKFTTSPAPSGTVDCAQGNLCWSLIALGVRDERLHPAYDWLARSQTGEGIAPKTDANAVERYYAYKCGPNLACGANGGKACAWGAVKVLLALNVIPAEWETAQTTQARQMTVDLLLSVDPAIAAYPQRIAGKPNRSWWKFGFPIFYITDILQLVEVLLAAGCMGDPRLDHALELIQSAADAQGRWKMDYDLTGKTWVNYGPLGQPNKWVTYRALKVLKLAGR